MKNLKIKLSKRLHRKAKANPAAKNSNYSAKEFVAVVDAAVAARKQLMNRIKNNGLLNISAVVALKAIVMVIVIANIAIAVSTKTFHNAP